MCARLLSVLQMRTFKPNFSPHHAKTSQGKHRELTPHAVRISAAHGSGSPLELASSSHVLMCSRNQATSEPNSGGVIPNKGHLHVEPLTALAFEHAPRYVWAKTLAAGKSQRCFKVPFGMLVQQMTAYIRSPKTRQARGLPHRV